MQSHEIHFQDLIFGTKFSGYLRKMGPKKDHEACRLVVCAVCWGESGRKAGRAVSEAEEAAIREFVVSSYSKRDPRFPAGICDNCHFILRDWIKGQERPRPLPVAEKFMVDLAMMTRSSLECTCAICKLARMNGLEWKRFSDSKNKRKTPFNKGDKLCSKCFSRIYPGSNHSAEVCRSKAVAVENLSQVSPQVLEQVLHGHLKAAGASGDQAIKVGSVTGGKPMTVTLGHHPDQPVPNPLSAQDILTIQNEANLSDRLVLYLFPCSGLIF